VAPARRLVYRCIESMLKVDEVENYRRSMELLYGVETLGPDMEGSPMQQTLLAACDRLFA
jgi:ribosomal protein S12 methylthiotransferase accessory factor